jgi:hypothetical protein
VCPLHLGEWRKIVLIRHSQIRKAVTVQAIDNFSTCAINQRWLTKIGDFAGIWGLGDYKFYVLSPNPLIPAYQNLATAQVAIFCRCENVRAYGHNTPSCRLERSPQTLSFLSGYSWEFLI